MENMPTIGRIGYYRTDGRNGLTYDLPAIVTVTHDSHPGDYEEEKNPLPRPAKNQVHLTVFTPGGFGTKITGVENHTDKDFVGASSFLPGSGTYVELNVPVVNIASPRTWRWPT